MPDAARPDIEGLLRLAETATSPIAWVTSDLAEGGDAVPALARYALDLEIKLRAADRLAFYVFDQSHSDDCESAGESEPCECICGTEAAKRDALIIRPQGVCDPQPAKETPDA